MSRQQDSSFVLAVVDGAHADTEIELGSGTYTIGSSRLADLVLTDPGVAPLHARIAFEARRVRLEAVEEPVFLDFGRAVEPGGAVVRRLPATIRLGEACLMVRESAEAESGLPGATDPPPRRLVSLPRLVGLAAIVGIVATISFNQLLRSDTGTAEAASSRLLTARPAVRPPASVQDGLAALRDHLRETGLAERIRLSADGNAILAEGGIGPASSEQWLQAQRWFDAAYQGRLVLISHVGIETAGTAPHLKLQALWAGPAPYIITGDGERYGEGAVIEGGWRIERIEHLRVVLKRGNEVRILNL